MDRPGLEKLGKVNGTFILSPVECREIIDYALDLESRIKQAEDKIEKLREKCGECQHPDPRDGVISAGCILSILDYDCEAGKTSESTEEEGGGGEITRQIASLRDIVLSEVLKTDEEIKEVGTSLLLKPHPMSGEPFFTLLIKGETIRGRRLHIELQGIDADQMVKDMNDCVVEFIRTWPVINPEG